MYSERSLSTQNSAKSFQKCSACTSGERTNKRHKESGERGDLECWVAVWSRKGRWEASSEKNLTNPTNPNTENPAEHAPIRHFEIRRLPFP